MGHQHVIFEKQDQIARIRLNRPEKRNALTSEMINLLMGFLRQAQRDDDVRVVVISGEGASFCAGLDLSSVKNVHQQSFHSLMDDSNRHSELYLCKHSMDKPIVCQVHGATVGLGIVLVLISHIVIASEDAFFSIPELNFGLAPLGVMAYLAPVVGIRNVTELALTGRKIDVDTAMRWGLVHYRSTREELDATVHRIVSELLDKDPLALKFLFKATNDLELNLVNQVKSVNNGWLALNFAYLKKA